MTETALVIVDMQNDFLHPDGAYAKSGATSENLSVLAEKLAPVTEIFRSQGCWIVSTHFTLVPGKNGEPFISDHLKRLRPFLGKGDFLSGSFGHALVDLLSPSDLCVDKVAYSAFYMSRLEWTLNQAGIKNLVFSGIVTNGGVASTARDAHVRGYRCTILEDGCAAFSQKEHDIAIKSLASISAITDCKTLLRTRNLQGLLEKS
ncbi:MAG: cysteine hydrolase [Pseudomonadota bacterium]|nr:cysteine hydrolase [Pseudomonadota bacterium]